MLKSSKWEALKRTSQVHRANFAQARSSSKRFLSLSYAYLITKSTEIHTKFTRFTKHFANCILNGRIWPEYVLDCFLNMSLLLTWLIFIKLFNNVPKELRPRIFHRLCMRLDAYMFENTMGAILSILCLVSGSWLLYQRFFTSKNTPTYINLQPQSPVFGSPTSSGTTSLELSFPSDIRSKSLEYNSPADIELEDEPTTPDTKESILPLTIPKLPSSYFSSSSTTIHIGPSSNFWHSIAPFFLSISWFLLYFVYQFNSTVSIEKSKFITGWVAYVVLYVLAPMITSVWLYLFKAPGSLKLFVLACGIQNVLIILTHFVFPNAPPLFIKLYGDNLSPSYDMTYTDGITRQDIKVNRYIYQSIYYAAPNKFSSFPSLHSAMAVMIFLFICYYADWVLFKLLALAHVLLQWWSAIYLDHHWRVDLLAGAIYAIFAFTVIKLWKNRGLDSIDEVFKIARLKNNWYEGSTFGMRLFRSTKFEHFFDPLHA